MIRNLLVTIFASAVVISGFTLIARADDDQKKTDLSGTWKWTVPAETARTWTSPSN